MVLDELEVVEELEEVEDREDVEELEEVEEVVVPRGVQTAPRPVMALKLSFTLLLRETSNLVFWVWEASRV